MAEIINIFDGLIYGLDTAEQRIKLLKNRPIETFQTKM